MIGLGGITLANHAFSEHLKYKRLGYCCIWKQEERMWWDTTGNVENINFRILMNNTVFFDVRVRFSSGNFVAYSEPRRSKGPIPRTFNWDISWLGLSV